MSRAVWCTYRSDKREVLTDESETINHAVARHYKIPQKHLKLVCKGRMLEEPSAAEAVWAADNASVFFVVGVPLTEAEIAERRRLKQEKEAALKLKQEQVETERERERLLLEKHKAWANEEEVRLQREAEEVQVRSRQRSGGACSRITTTVRSLRAIDVQAYKSRLGLLGDILSVCALFVTSFVMPTDSSEEEKMEQDLARQRDQDQQDQRAGRRGMGRVDHRTPVTASMGGGG